MKVLVWKSYGNVSVYNLESEESAKKVYDELIEVLAQGDFHPKAETVNDLVNWINFHDIGDDWDSFEYIAIKEVE